jgi:NAD(P)-dependent dehydrogenase (short-subunit alcohol dehydrogenase family)
MTDYVFEHFLRDIEEDCPLGRIGKPEEIVGIMAYLASRAGSYTNGAVIPVDGGTNVSKGRRDWMM